VSALIAFSSIAFSAATTAQVTRTDPPRGELLYSTYCVSCHTTEIHWRANKLAIDWTSLKYQVRRWQANLGLGLDEDDIVAIALYLNRLHYHFPPEENGRPKA